MTGDVTRRTVRVAVIDSGVHAAHPHITAERLLPGVAIDRDGTVLLGGADAAIDRLGHGTAVTAAIQEKAPDALILPVRVFHAALATSARALANAIIWSIDQGADIINLSLGTTNAAHSALFEPLVMQASKAGALIVAPRAVDDVPCWPGSLPNVLAVGVDWDVPRETWRVADGICFASGYPRPIPGVPLQRNLYGVSFATAQMSGFAAAFLASRDAARADEARSFLQAGPVDPL